MRLLAEGATPREGVRLVTDLRPDVLVVDTTRETEVPIEAAYLQELLRRHEGTRVLALVSGRRRGQLHALLMAGVGGVVSRDGDPESIAAGVVAVGEGRDYYNLERHTETDEVDDERAAAHPGHVTRRELDVLRLVAGGLTNRAIGERLQISETTAKFHVTGLMRKFGVHTRAEIVYFAAQQGLV